MPFIAKRVYHKNKIISSKKREDKKMMFFRVRVSEMILNFRGNKAKKNLFE